MTERNQDYREVPISSLSQPELPTDYFRIRSKSPDSMPVVGFDLALDDSNESDLSLSVLYGNEMEWIAIGKEYLIAIAIEEQHRPLPCSPQSSDCSRL